MPIRDYLFRYDRGCFFMAYGIQNPVIRFLLGWAYDSRFMFRQAMVKPDEEREKISVSNFFSSYEKRYNPSLPWFISIIVCISLHRWFKMFLCLSSNFASFFYIYIWNYQFIPCGYVLSENSSQNINSSLPVVLRSINIFYYSVDIFFFFSR